jgi:hypothetical protein
MLSDWGNALWRARKASVGVIPPTGTPSIVTRSGNTCEVGGATVVVGAVVVAGVVVVVPGMVVVGGGGGSARTAAEAPPASASPSAKRRARPLRLTAEV